MFIHTNDLSNFHALVGGGLEGPTPERVRPRNRFVAEIEEIAKCLERSCSEDELKIHLRRIQKLTVEALDHNWDEILYFLNHKVETNLFNIVEGGKYSPGIIILCMQTLFMFVSEAEFLKMINVLRRLLKHPIPEIREKAADLLEPSFERFHHDGLIERALADRLINDGSGEVRQACAISLQRWAKKCKPNKKISPGIRALLVKATDMEDKETQVLAQRSLDFLDFPYPKMSHGTSD